MGARHSKTVYLNNTRGRRHRDKKKIFLGVVGLSIVIGAGVAFMPNAYEIKIEDEVVGIVGKKEYIEAALDTVEAQLEQRYSTQVQMEEIDTIKKVRAAKKEMMDPNKLATALREKLGVTLEFQELVIDDEVVGIIESKEMLENLKTELKKRYFDDADVRAEFANEVRLKPVFTTEDQLINLDDLVALCSKREKKLVTYEVQPGDSLWLIANKMGVSTAAIVSVNEGMSETPTLQIGQQLKVEVRVPKLGLNLISLPEETQKEND